MIQRLRLEVSLIASGKISRLGATHGFISKENPVNLVNPVKKNP
jgi:hypothetical protein